jgi:hypothetical protein
MLWRRFLSLKNFADKIYGIKRDFYDKIKKCRDCFYLGTEETVWKNIESDKSHEALA